jgi:hypothetical protein
VVEHGPHVAAGREAVRELGVELDRLGACLARAADQGLAEVSVGFERIEEIGQRLLPAPRAHRALMRG